MELGSCTHTYTQKKKETSLTTNATNMLKENTFLLYHMASCYYGIGMTSDYTQDGIRTVAKTILDKQSLISDKRLSSSFGVARKVTSHSKILAC